MVLSAPATSDQLGLLLHAAVVITALKLSAKFNTCEGEVAGVMAGFRRLQIQCAHLAPRKKRADLAASL